MKKLFLASILIIFLNPTLIVAQESLEKIGIVSVLKGNPVRENQVLEITRVYLTSGNERFRLLSDPKIQKKLQELKGVEIIVWGQLVSGTEEGLKKIQVRKYSRTGEISGVLHKLNDKENDLVLKNDFADYHLMRGSQAVLDELLNNFLGKRVDLKGVYKGGGFGNPIPGNRKIYTFAVYAIAKE